MTLWCLLLVQLSTTFWSGDAFNVCHCRLPRDVTFDVISTSNLVDHVGLLNLLVTCQPRLKQYDDYATRTLCLSVCLSVCVLSCLAVICCIVR